MAVDDSFFLHPIQTRRSLVVLDPIRNSLIDAADAIPNEFLCAPSRHELILVVFSQAAFPIQSNPAAPMPCPPVFQMSVFFKESSRVCDFCLELIESPDLIMQDMQVRKLFSLSPSCYHTVGSWAVFNKRRCPRDSFWIVPHEDVGDRNIA